MSAPHYLDFEKPIMELERKIDEIRQLAGDGLNLDADVAAFQARINQMRADVFANLNRWQTTQVARHVNRPFTLDYIRLMFTEFTELHGDRNFGDDHALVCGLARFEGCPIAVIGHQKGRDTKEKVFRNFGMPNPEGYRKALRIMQMAEQFKLPVITFVDTPGAYPGIGAEERGQAEAIARNLREMSSLRIPIVTIITGEGGSGGALAIAVGNRILMLEHSVYSVISPEGCAAILWSDGTKGAQAAEALKLTARDIIKLGVIDEIVKEPVGGAHRNHETMAATLKQSLSRHLQELNSKSGDELVEDRYRKFRAMSQFVE
ncbi:MAG TPA: acetyl-CoA carboxylase carboxyltransferase subunit alpha [Deltaproteobacteria bacterium]|nr:acetyl-CoA carboxylase carboxyltransferase subunit alpha [Deltaproteobacteria bacterium]HQB38480.1 acetyl-CoA carboxylase carboxyltransferase subunit alpha [Deltaproteobacteria bacterium]